MTDHTLKRMREGCVAQTRPACDISVTTHYFDDDGVIPNNPKLPVVVISDAIAPGASAPEIMGLFEANGWRRVWHASIFEYQHYHPTAHEVLACQSGWADLQIGGPSGDIFRIKEGDVVILPAGTGHCLIDSRDNFSVCGGYPAGQEDREIVRGIRQNRGNAVGLVAATKIAVTDPIFGEVGPLLTHWRR